MDFGYFDSPYEYISHSILKNDARGRGFVPILRHSP